MKKLIIIFLSFVLVLSAAYFIYSRVEFDSNINGDLSAGVTTGSPAADFKVYDSEGNSVNLSDNKGKPTVVNFWATWCSPCKEELPYFNTLAEEMGDKVNFMMVNVEAGSDNTFNDVLDFVKKNNYSFPVYHDRESDASKAYGVQSIPMTLFIDAQGNIVGSRIGSMSEKMLRDYIAEIDK